MVDDTIFNLMAAKAIFQKIYPNHVEEASSGQMAIELVKASLLKSCYCKNRTFKIIFMDI